MLIVQRRAVGELWRAEMSCLGGIRIYREGEHYPTREPVRWDPSGLGSIKGEVPKPVKAELETALRFEGARVAMTMGLIEGFEP